MTAPLLGADGGRVARAVDIVVLVDGDARVVLGHGDGEVVVLVGTAEGGRVELEEDGAATNGAGHVVVDTLVGAVVDVQVVPEAEERGATEGRGAVGQRLVGVLPADVLAGIA